jgi:hypothetical protein
MRDIEGLALEERVAYLEGVMRSREAVYPDGPRGVGAQPAGAPGTHSGGTHFRAGAPG